MQHKTRSQNLAEKNIMFFPKLHVWHLDLLCNHGFQKAQASPFLQPCYLQCTQLLPLVQAGSTLHLKIPSTDVSWSWYPHQYSKVYTVAYISHLSFFVMVFQSFFSLTPTLLYSVWPQLLSLMPSSLQLHCFKTSTTWMSLPSFTTTGDVALIRAPHRIGYKAFCVVITNT